MLYYDAKSQNQSIMTKRTFVRREYEYDDSSDYCYHDCVVDSSCLPQAQLDRILEGLGIGQTAGLSDEKIGSGLKEALRLGQRMPSV